MSEGDQRLYNPNRDVAHNFPAIVKEVAGRLEDERWEAVTKYMKEQGANMDDLGAACEAFVNFVHGAVDEPNEKMGEVLHRVGWFKLPEAAQVAYMAYLGTVMSGVFFVGAREATIGGEGPCSNLEDLQQAGRDCHKAMTRSKWRRAIGRFFGRFTRAWNALFGSQGTK
jgi:hypothetical protein